MEPYEFTSEQNSIIRLLSSRMKFVAIFLFIIGGLVALTALQTLFAGGSYFISLAMAVIYILMAVWTLKASKSFMEVVQTEGSDINHIMKAISSLLSLYSLQFWLFIIMVILMILTIIIAAGTSGTVESSKLLH